MLVKEVQFAGRRNVEMALLTAFLSLLVCVAGCNHDNRFANSLHLVDMLQTLCPGANVCSRNQTSKEHLKPSPFGITSCCTECSCQLTCEDSGSCCFPNRTQQLDEQPFRKGHDCLFPFSVQPLAEDRFRYYSYLMVSEVGKTSTDEINSTSVCGNENIAPWGSLYPVYSAKRKQIYKNSACAEADGVDDGQLWDAEILCNKQHDAIGSDISLFIQELDSKSVPEFCQVNFRYRGKAEDIHMQKCYLDLVDTCRASDFSIPNGVSISKREIIDACTSGLLSPYRGQTMYANVFCRICSADVFHLNDKCLSVTDVQDRGSADRGFSALLDTGFITTIQKNTYGEMTKYPKACHIQNINGLNKMGCRRVFCPSGQLHDEAGQCRHPSKLWYHQVYQINIELTAEVKLDINNLFQVKSGSVSNTLPDLRIPRGNKWTVDSIHYENIDENENITKFVVILNNNLPQVHPQQFLQNIESIASRDWVLKHNKATTLLKSNFLKCADLYKNTTNPLDHNTFRCSAMNKDSVTDFENYSKNITKPVFLRVYMAEHGGVASRHIITKLYLCDQIELTENDFILSQNKRLLFNKFTTKFMFDAEFELLSGNTFDGLRARICINDSGFYRPSQAASSFGRLSYNIYCTLLLSVVFFSVGES